MGLKSRQKRERWREADALIAQAMLGNKKAKEQCQKEWPDRLKRAYGRGHPVGYGGGRWRRRFRARIRELLKIAAVAIHTFGMNPRDAGQPLREFWFGEERRDQGVGPGQGASPGYGEGTFGEGDAT